MDTAAAIYNRTIDEKYAEFMASKRVFDSERTMKASVNDATAFTTELLAHLSDNIARRYPQYQRIADELEDLSEVTDDLRDSAESFLDWLADQRTMNAFNIMRGRINSADGFRINAELLCMSSYYLRYPEDEEREDEEIWEEDRIDYSDIFEYLEYLEELDEFEEQEEL